MCKPTDEQRGARRSERGAALITVLLMATLLLMAGAALIAVTSTSATNAADATSESQAYYAAEAGMQAVLGVLRGSSAPNPLFNTTDPTDDANKISFRKAVTAAQSNKTGSGTPRLTRWLNFDATYTDRVVLNTAYAPLTGMAFGVDEISDPDNSTVINYTTTGSFATGAVPSGLNVTYTGRAASALDTAASGAATLGTFNISASSNGTYTLTNATFTLTIAQTAPWAATKAISCTANGSITKTGSNLSGTITLTFPASKFTLEDVDYTLSSTTLAITTTATATISVTLTAPEPQRLRVKVTGYGPHNAVKKMQMLVSRFAFDYNAASTIALRSSDYGVVLNASIGSSAVYGYNGNDNANGPDLPAFTVTGSQDAAFINGINSANTSSGSQVQGTPGPARLVSVSSLDEFLRTTDGDNGARATLDMLRKAAKNERTPGCTGTADACDRYYASGETPSNIGAGTNDGLFTFVDGDYSMPPAGGAGLLVVTGTLTMTGNADYKGLILVLGQGHVERNGGGGDTSLGAMAVARFDSSGNFKEPTFNVQGGGSSHINYDSDWVRKALKDAGPRVLGVSEY